MVLVKLFSGKMMEKKVKTTRIQLELPERSFKRLQDLKDRTEAASYTEVVRDALRIYESLIAQNDTGRRLYLRDEAGNIVECEMFLKV